MLLLAFRQFPWHTHPFPIQGARTRSCVLSAELYDNFGKTKRSWCGPFTGRVEGIVGPWHIVVPSPHVRPQRVLMLGGAEKGRHTGMLCVEV